MKGRIAKLLVAVAACASFGLVSASSASAGAFWFCGGYYTPTTYCTSPNAHVLTGVSARAKYNDNSTNPNTLVCAGIGSNRDDDQANLLPYACGWGSAFQPTRDPNPYITGFPKVLIYYGQPSLVDGLAYVP
jgi:hypothetical protein